MRKTWILIAFLIPSLALADKPSKQARALETEALDKIVKLGFSEKRVKLHKSGKKKLFRVNAYTNKELVTYLKAFHSALASTRHPISFEDVCEVEIANYAYAKLEKVKRDGEDCLMLALPNKAPPANAPEAMIEGLSTDLGDEPVFQVYDVERRKLLAAKVKKELGEWGPHYDLAETLFCGPAGSKAQEISPAILKAALEKNLGVSAAEADFQKIDDKQIPRRFEIASGKTSFTFMQTDQGGCLAVARETPYDQEDEDLQICFSNPYCHFKGGNFVERDKKLRMLRRATMLPQSDILEEVIGEMDVKGLEKIYKKVPKPIKDPVVVGVIDSGIDFNHPALAKYVVRQINAKWFFAWLRRTLLGSFFKAYLPPGDDFETSPYSAGFDLVHGDMTPFDQNEGESHGTLVAGLIVPDTTRVQILPIKSDYDDPEKLIPLLEVLIPQGIRLFNFSSTFTRKEDSDSLRRLIQKFPEAIFVVASGNDPKDLATSPVYPACFPEPNVIAVSGATKDGTITTSFGKACADLAAWGVDVPGPCPVDDTCTDTGSSFAAPQVTRAVVLMMERDPGIKTEDVLKLLAQGLRRTKDTEEKTQMGGMLDLKKIKQLVKKIPKPKPH